MDITIEQFIESFNRTIDWNNDIRKTFRTTVFTNPVTKQIIDDYLSTRKITPEEYNLEEATLLKDGDNRYELQAESKTSYSMVWFWVTLGESEQDYKNRKHKHLMEEVTKACTERAAMVNKISSELAALRALVNALN